MENSKATVIGYKQRLIFLQWSISTICETRSERQIWLKKDVLRAVFTLQFHTNPANSKSLPTKDAQKSIHIVSSNWHNSDSNCLLPIFHTLNIVCLNTCIHKTNVSVHRPQVYKQETKKKMLSFNN